MTRALSEAMAEALAGGATTFCRCWLVERTDGVSLGFTDHDGALAFGGNVFEPNSGFAQSEIERGLGLSVDNMEAQGALRSDAVTEADVLAGRYDGAKVTQWLVDWSAPARREVVFAGHVGEIRRGTQAFEVEFTGLAEPLNRPRGRVYLRRCDAELGDARCGVSLTGVPGEVIALRGERLFAVSGFGDAVAYPAGWASLGRLVWTQGGNAGEAAPVRLFSRVPGGGAEVELWAPPGVAAAVGDRFELFAGCDKAAETCRDKFGNLAGFRGFPHMPGEDWVTAYPGVEESHDGGSLFR